MRPGAAIAAVVACTLQVGASTAAAADPLPAFKPGKWEFTRTVETPGGKPTVMRDTRCTSPTEDMKQQRTKLEAIGCKLSAPARSGNAYAYDAVCSIRGAPAESKNTMTVESDSAYAVQVKLIQGGKPASTETLKARRVGDC